MVDTIEVKEVKTNRDEGGDTTPKREERASAEERSGRGQASRPERTALQEFNRALLEFREKLEQRVPQLSHARDIDEIRKAIDTLPAESVHRYIEDFEKIARELEVKQIKTGSLSEDERLLMEKARSLRRYSESTRLAKAIEESQGRGGILSSDSALARQVFQEFSRFTSGNVEITPEGQQMIVTIDGRREMTLPDKVTPVTMIQLTQKLIEKGYLPEQALEKLGVFAKELQDTALVMDEEVFSQSAISFTYNAGRQLEVLLKAPTDYDPAKYERVTFEEIQDESRSTKLSVQRKQEIFLNIILGKQNASVEHALQITESRSKQKEGIREGYANLYEAWFARWYRRNAEHVGKMSPEAMQGHFEDWLGEPETRQHIMRMASSSIEKGLATEGDREGKLVAKMRQKVETQALPFLPQLEHWKQLVLETEYGQGLSREATRISSESGSFEEKLQRINALFQPQQKVEALEYLPSEVVKLFQENNAFGERNVAACALAVAYTRKILEGQGMDVWTSLEGSHMRLVVLDPLSGRVFRMDPNTPLRGEEKEGIEDITSSDIAREVLNGKEIIRTKNNGQSVVISKRKEIELSSFLSNMSAMARNGELVEKGWSPELQFAAAQYAATAFPDNAMAWLLMSQLATDGRNKEYLNQALRLDPSIQEAGQENKYKIGDLDRTIFEITRDQYGREGVSGLTGIGKEIIRNRNRERIDEVIENLDPNDYNEYGTAIEKLATEAMREAVAEGKDRTEGLARYIVEYALERIIGAGDLTTGDPYKQARLPTPQLSLEKQYSIERLMSVAEKIDRMEEATAKGNHRPARPDSLLVYLKRLQATRQATHELFRSMRDKEQFTKGVAEYLNREGLQFVEHEIVGVAKTQRLYEKIWARMASKHKGWPKPEEFEDADRELGRVMVQLGASGGLKYLSEGDYSPGHSNNQPVELRPWQIRRAALEGMRLSALSQRRLTFAVLGDVPSNVADYLKSVEGEFIARSLASLKLIPYRFFRGTGWDAQKFFMQKIVENFRRQNGETQFGFKAYKNGKATGEWTGLYGQKEESMAMLDTGAVDAKSNSWRVQLLFLRQREYQMIERDGKRYTIGEYLDAMKKKAKEDLLPTLIRKDEGVHLIPDSEDEKKADRRAEGNYGFGERVKEKFNELVGEEIKRQRLFLGVLMRWGDLDSINKAYIWRNVALFQPSRIAAFLPNDTIEVNGVKRRVGDLPDKLMSKLYLIEEQRVNDDAIRLRTNTNPDVSEADFNEQKQKELQPRAMELQELDYYFDFTPGVSLDEEEKAIIHALQELGIRRAAEDSEGKPLFEKKNGEWVLKGDKPDLSKDEAKKLNGDIAGGFVKIKFPFTSLLDDAPATNWEGISAEDLPRLLLSDQQNFEKGSQAITGLILNPIQKPEDVLKVLHEALEAYGSPMGIPDAQGKMLAYVTAYAELTKSSVPAKYFGAIMKMLRMPRSELEKANRKANIAHSELILSDLFDSAAQHEIIADENRAGVNMYLALKKRFNADRLGVIIAWARILLLILGPVATVSLLKAFLPEGMQKALG